jgi:hypothetical protein
VDARRWGDVFGALDRLRAATARVTVASGVLNIWPQTAEATNAWWSTLSPADRDRTPVGLGVSHGLLIGETWARPLDAMRAFLDALAVPPISSASTAKPVSQGFVIRGSGR